MSFVRCLVLLTVIVALLGLHGSAQDYPKARPGSSSDSKAHPKPDSKDGGKRKAPAPSNKVSGTFTGDGQTMKIVDGMALFDVDENRIAQTRNPEVTLFLTDARFTTAEWDTIRETALEPPGLQRLSSFMKARKSRWLEISIKFDPALGLYSPRSARWYGLNYSGKRGSYSSISILGDGIKELDKAHPILKVDPQSQRLKLRSIYQGWDLDLDVTMWVRHQY